MSESSTPTKEATYSKGAVEAARQIFQSFDELHATDIPLAAKIIDRELKYPALLESHKQLQEYFAELYLDICKLEIPDPSVSSFSIGWNAAIHEARAISSKWLAKAKEITNGRVHHS